MNPFARARDEGRRYGEAFKAREATIASASERRAQFAWVDARLGEAYEAGFEAGAGRPL